MKACKKCGCFEFKAIQKGAHIGIYCTECGQWQKWANKNDLNLLELKKEKTEVLDIEKCKQAYELLKQVFG